MIGSYGDKEFSGSKEVKRYEKIPEECPKCGSKGELFVCSRGAVNCAGCMSFIGIFDFIKKKDIN